MDKISSKDLIKNSELISGYFREVKDVIIVDADIKIVFPERFVEKEFVFLGNTIRLLGIYGIIDDNNNYAYTLAPIFQELSPSNVSEIMIDGVLNKVLEFKKGDIFMVDTTLVKTDAFIYDLYNEFYIKGNMPWFLKYNETSEILLESNKYADSNIGNNPLAFEILSAIISRDSEDKTKYVKNLIENDKQKLTQDVTYVGLNNIYYSYTNTGSRVIGGYYGSGISTAMVDPEKKSTDLMDILR